MQRTPERGSHRSVGTAGADFWADVVTPGMTLSAANLEQGVDKLRKTQGNLARLQFDKYDGIDLPDDACRILIVDGVPDTRRLIDAYEQGTLSDSERFLSRQIQRIEQGMGRGIRSNEDYCIVILMGVKSPESAIRSGCRRALFASNAKTVKAVA